MPALIGMIVFFVITFFIIKFAIDCSETGRNIRIIKNILTEKFEYKEEMEEEPDTGFDITSVSVDRCPACNAELRTGDRYCSACGLRILSIKEKDEEE